MSAHNLQTILIIEDDQATRVHLKHAIEADDFLVFDAGNLDRGLKIVDHHKVQLILLDLHLNGVSALAHIPEFKSKADVPLLVLSAEDSEARKIECFNKGADDFIDKPISPPMLLARIKSHLRRRDFASIAAGQTPSDTARNDSKLIYFDRWIMDPDRIAVYDSKGTAAGLTRQEFDLLRYLAANRGRALSRHDICEAIKNENYVPTARALDVKIARIRKKLEDDMANPFIIKTVRGVGYMMEQGTDSA